MGSAKQDPSAPSGRLKESFRDEGPEPLDCTPVLGSEGTGDKGKHLVHPNNENQFFYKYKIQRTCGSRTDTYYIIWDRGKKELVPFKNCENMGRRSDGEDRYSIRSGNGLIMYYLRLLPEAAEPHEPAAENAEETQQQAAENAEETQQQAAENAEETQQQAAENADETQQQAAAPTRTSTRNKSVEELKRKCEALEQNEAKLKVELEKLSHVNNALKDNFWKAFFDKIGPNMPKGEDQQEPVYAPFSEMESFLFNNALDIYGQLPLELKHNMLFSLFQFPGLSYFTKEMRDKLGLVDGVDNGFKAVQKAGKSIRQAGKSIRQAGKSIRHCDLTEDALRFVHSKTWRNAPQYFKHVQIYCYHVEKMLDDILGEGWNLDTGITSQKNPVQRLYNKQSPGNEGQVFWMYKFEGEMFKMSAREQAEHVEEELQTWCRDLREQNKMKAKSIHEGYNPGGKGGVDTTYLYVHFYYTGNRAAPT
jgi:hypothetical protein